MVTLIPRPAFLGGFYSLPMSDRDKAKAKACGMKKVMVTFEHGRGDLEWLIDNSFDVTMRLDEPDYKPARWDLVIGFFNGLTPRQREGLELVVVGCEPEQGLDMTWTSETGWGNEIKDPVLRLTRLEEHAQNFHNMREALQGMGLVVCSPGWLCRDQDMRFGPPPNHGPQPGVARWAMYLLEEYGKAQYNCEHAYLFDGSDFDIDQRLERIVNRAITYRQKELVFDEINVGPRPGITKEEAMQHALAMAERLRHLPRCVRATIFVFNGTPIDEHGNEQWPPHQLVDSDVCYDMLARWYAEPGV
jgi:hypothetical protein